MSTGAVIAVAIAGLASITITALLGYALGHIVGERDEARRILRYVDPPDVSLAVRDAILGGVGLPEPPRVPGKED